jgi:hypothetical protein
MSDLIDLPRPHSRAIAAIVCALLGAAFTSDCVWSQAMQQQPAPQKSMIIQVAPLQVPPAPVPVQQSQGTSTPEPPAAPVGAAPPPENPGLINEIGKLFKNSTSMLPPMPTLNVWGSSDGLTRLNTIVKGRVVCPVAANGAPDCKAASNKLCQGKGFKGGKSVDTDAAQSCSAKAMIPGRKAEEGDCKTENYVTQALCQ